MSNAATNRVAAFLSATAAVVVTLAAMLPWQHVSKCIWQCSAFPYHANWNVLQVGGSWVPSAFTGSGIAILVGASLFALVFLSALQGRVAAWVRTKAKWIGVLAAALVASGSLLVPTPSYPATPPLYFSTTQGIGPWVCLLGALLGLLSAALFARGEARVLVDSESPALRSVDDSLLVAAR